MERYPKGRCQPASPRLPPSAPAVCPGLARPAPVTLSLPRLSRWPRWPIIENSRVFRPTRPKAGYPINPASRNEKSPPPRAMIT